MNNIAEANAGLTTPKVDLALIHYPVVNKNGETIGSAVTNLDLHDIARAARTFGVDTLYIVTPYQDQQQLLSEILQYWLKGRGAEYNGKRGEALSVVRLCSDLAELHGLIIQKRGGRPHVLTTCARLCEKTWAYSLVRQKITAGESFLILLGTAWGLASEVMKSADGALPPIKGSGEYNHLSVRSAASIILDRLLGEREEVIINKQTEKYS